MALLITSLKAGKEIQIVSVNLIRVVTIVCAYSCSKKGCFQCTAITDYECINKGGCYIWVSLYSEAVCVLKCAINSVRHPAEKS